MVSRPHKHNEIAEICGFNYSSKAQHEEFRKEHLKQICDYLQLETSGIRGELKNRIAEKSGIRWDYIPQTNTDRRFNSFDLDKILKTVKKRRKELQAQKQVVE